MSSNIFDFFLSSSSSKFNDLRCFPSSPDYWGGWACFFASIIMIGVLTAVIGDLASSFGCTIGLKDAVTAISFVALGTSVPGKSGLKDPVTAVLWRSAPVYQVSQV